MARKNQFVRPFPKQDPLYKSRLVSVFITSLMKSGKKTVAERMVYTALSILKGKKERPVSLLMRAVKNITPRLTVKAIQTARKGGGKRRRRRRRKLAVQAAKSNAQTTRQQQQRQKQQKKTAARRTKKIYSYRTPSI